MHKKYKAHVISLNYRLRYIKVMIAHKNTSESNKRAFSMLDIISPKSLRWIALTIAFSHGTGCTAENLASNPSFAQGLKIDQLTPFNTLIEEVVFEGRQTVKVQEPIELLKTNEDNLAILSGIDFHNGEIEIWLAGTRNAEAAESARGFTGIAFRIADDPTEYEAIYVRPTNGRADDQQRRNHSIQYISHPEYTWNKLRSDTPSKYEAYADMEPGKWIKYRLVVEGERAELYLNDAEQPNLIVKDLKLGDKSGRIGLWIASGTTAYFSDIKVSD